MQLSQQLGVSLRQEHRLSQQMIASLELMALPAFELQQRIGAELENNPVLEMQESRVESLDEHTEKYRMVEMASDADDYIPQQSTGGEERAGFPIEQHLSRGESLKDHLLAQLRLQRLSGAEYTLGREIIDNLDENGFHRKPLAELGARHDSARLNRVLRIVQRFDPYGIGVADLRESLLLQASILGDMPPCVEQILLSQRLFQLLEEKKTKEIMKTLGAGADDVHVAGNYIATLTPYPGRQFSLQEVEYITPDLYILYHENKFQIGLHNNFAASVKINKFYLNISDTSTDSDSKKFIKSYLQDGKNFIRSLQRRQQTLVRTAYALLDRQGDFFRFGPQRLAPLTLKDIAEMVELHETTISRVVNKKYIETNWGIFPISFLFSNRVSVDSQQSVSKIAVKERIRQLLDSHQQAHKGTGNEKTPRLSDQKITALLEEEDIHISRRTVNKYRNQLASIDRK